MEPRSSQEAKHNAQWKTKKGGIPGWGIRDCSLKAQQVSAGRNLHANTPSSVWYGQAFPRSHFEGVSTVPLPTPPALPGSDTADSGWDQVSSNQQCRVFSCNPQLGLLQVQLEDPGSDMSVLILNSIL